MNRTVTTEAFLSLRLGPGGAQRWDLPDAGGALTLGRAADSDVCILGDPQVSRVHARLERVGGRWTVVDDGLSVNGTYLNGRRVTGRARLRDRDLIRLGETVLVFCSPPQTGTDQTVAGVQLPAVRALTEPQRRVLVALCRPYHGGQGFPTPASNQQIGQELFLSLDAVKTHLRVLYQRFGIQGLPQNRKRARLAEMALQLGLIPDDPH